MVRAIKIEDGMGISIVKEEFVKLILSEDGTKITKQFNLNIQNISDDWVSIEFEDKSVDKSKRTWIDVTPEHFKQR